MAEAPGGGRKISISGFANNAGGAVSELFAAEASRAKADMFRTTAKLDTLKGRGLELEGENLARAGDLALLNKEYTAASTAVQVAQADRAITLGLGGVRAGAAAAGLKLEGSAEDVLMASAMQGEIEKSVLAEQGLITEAGYQESADSYKNMVEASKIAVEGTRLSSEAHLRAAASEEDAATGHEIASVFKGVAAIASLFGM